MDFIHRPKSKILKFYYLFIYYFNILLFVRWIKSLNPSIHNIIDRRQNLL
jgi:hypothetical protein